MKIRKAKMDSKGKVRIEYEKESSEGVETHTLECEDSPRPEFQEALKALVGDVIEICEISCDADRITVLGVSFSWTHDIMGAVITAMKGLVAGGSPLLLNTPHRPSEPYGEKAGGPTLDLSTVKRLESVMDEATKYVMGERAQGTLPLKDEP